MKIYIDADGCPVVKQTIKLALKHKIFVTIVKNHAVEIKTENSNLIDVVTVDQSRDSADFYIANHVQPFDLVITQDYGLAAMILAKNAFCMNQNGRLYTLQNIDTLLDRRHTHREQRRKHKKNTSKFKKRTSSDDETYIMALESFLKKCLS